MIRRVIAFILTALIVAGYFTGEPFPLIVSLLFLAISYLLVRKQ